MHTSGRDHTRDEKVAKERGLDFFTFFIFLVFVSFVCCFAFPRKQVEKTSWHYKLEYGKYKRDGSKLYVQEATRYLLNKHLSNLLAQDPAESLGDDGKRGNGAAGGDGDGDKRSDGGGGGGEEGVESDGGGGGGDGGTRA